MVRTEELHTMLNRAMEQIVQVSNVLGPEEQEIIILGTAAWIAVRRMELGLAEELHERQRAMIDALLLSELPSQPEGGP